MLKKTLIRPAYFFLKKGKEPEVIGLNSVMLGLAISRIHELTGEPEEEIFDHLGSIAMSLREKSPETVNKIGLKLLSGQRPPNTGLGIIQIEICSVEEN